MSNFAKRIIVGVIAAPLILSIMYYGELPLLVLTLLVNCFCMWEFLKLFESKGLKPLKAAALVISCILIILNYLKSPVLLPAGIVTVLLFVSIEVFRKAEVRTPENPIVMLFGFLYITIPTALASELTVMTGYNALVYSSILIWSADSAAYFGGRKFGKTMLTSISPKKTREGAVISIIAAFVISLLYKFFVVTTMPLTDAIVLGIVIPVIAIIGDLFESLIKRYCDIKDSSQLIPGHGGLLDRCDSLLFVYPAVFIYLYFIYH